MGNPVRPYELDLHASFDATLREASDYFARSGRLHDTVLRLATNLDDHGIAYALVGGMALGRHGYVRMTDDIDVVITTDGLEAFHAQLVGRGYLASHVGAQRTFRDTTSGVRIEFRVTGEYPGDGRPKPIAFPDPAPSATLIDGLRVLTLPHLIELKLASGSTAPHRLRDLADVQELIRIRRLDEAFATKLDPSVREAYRELLRTAG